MIATGLRPSTERTERPEARDLIAFTQRMFPRYRAAEHHRLIAEYLQRVTDPADGMKRLIITMPPRHGKSELASVHFPAWFLATHPEQRIIACSHTAQLAYSFSRRARNKLTDPRWPFPEIRVAKDSGQVSAWNLAGRQGGYIAAGVGGAITGFGGDGILIDDPVKSAAEADSMTHREAVWEWYQGTLRTRLEPGGFIVVIGTRWHEDDLIGRLIRESEAGTGEPWTVLHLPALSDDGQPLWPERFDLDALMQIRQAVGSRNWEAQYQGQPTAVEGGTFKRHWWRFWQPVRAGLPPITVTQPDGSKLQVHAMEMPAGDSRGATSWDLTFGGEGDDGSYVVGLAGIRIGANGYMLGRYRDRPDFPGSIVAIRNFRQRFPDLATTLVEKKANGKAALDTLTSAIPGMIGVEPRGSKEVRADASTPRVEAGNWHLPHPLLPGAEWVQEFIDELAAFPTGTHDDQVDTFTQLDRYLFGNAAPSITEPRGVLAQWLAEQ